MKFNDFILKVSAGFCNMTRKGSSDIFSNEGYCITCDSETTFSSSNEWLRDYYICNRCGSIPRERALMFCIERYYPNWRELHVHESSPASRGASEKLRRCCAHYLPSHFFPDLPLGEIHRNGYSNENLEYQTFPDESFDLVISQDVMEHIFDPARAFVEIARTLKPGGAHIFSVPLVNKEKSSEICAVWDEKGNVKNLFEPEYHGNPIDEKGSLVTMRWGYDISDFIFKNGGLSTTINYIDNLSLGIRAEYIEILVSRKIRS